VRAKVVTVMRWYAQDEVNQEESKQNEVDRMKKGADSTVEVMHMWKSDAQTCSWISQVCYVMWAESGAFVWGALELTWGREIWAFTEKNLGILSRDLNDNFVTGLYNFIVILKATSWISNKDT